MAYTITKDINYIRYRIFCVLGGDGICHRMDADDARCNMPGKELICNTSLG